MSTLVTASQARKIADDVVQCRTMISKLPTTAIYVYNMRRYGEISQIAYPVAYARS